MRQVVAAYLGVLRRLDVEAVWLPGGAWQRLRERMPVAAARVREAPGRPDPGAVAVVEERKTAPAQTGRPHARGEVARRAEVAMPDYTASAVRGPAEKREALEALRAKVEADADCRKMFQRARQMVFGTGTADAELMFVGEAPGADEDAAGEPFVGKAGQLLDRMIKGMGMQREEVYIANIVKYRPDVPAGSRNNRKPTPEEMAACRPYVLEQIGIIRPKVLVALGATAVEGLLGLHKFPITVQRGGWRDLGGIPLMPTFHPAYVLRAEGTADERLVKGQVWEDLQQVLERLGRPRPGKSRKAS